MDDSQQNSLSEDLQALEKAVQVPGSDLIQEIEYNATVSFFTVSYSSAQGKQVTVNWYPRPYTRLIRIEQTPTANITTTLINGYHPQYPPYYDTHVSYNVTYQYELIGGQGSSIAPRYSAHVTPRPPAPARPVEFPPASDAESLETPGAEIEQSEQ